MRNIENDLRCRRRNPIGPSKTTREGPLTNRNRVILTFFIIGCLATFLFSGVRDVYGAEGISYSPSPVDFGDWGVGGSSPPTSFTIKNTSSKGVFLHIVDIPKWAPPERSWLKLEGNNCFDDLGNPKTLSRNESCTVTYSFHPYYVGEYSTPVNIRYSFSPYNTVNNLNVQMVGTGIKGTPTITWNNPADITYGTALSSTQLNAKALNASGIEVPGSYVYTPAVGTVLNAGNNQSLSVTFTPTDTVNYNTATKTVYINVLKATATVSLSNLTQTYTGSPLTPTASTTPGGLAIVWTNAPKTDVGSYSVIATINDTNYQGSVSATFIINKATVEAITLKDLKTQTYTGSALTPGVTTNPPNLAVIWSGTPSQPWINAGSYFVTATVNDPNYQGEASDTFIIQKATPTATLAVNNSPQTYNGSPLSATVIITASSVPGAVNNILTGGAATQTNASTYAVTADFVPQDTANYNTLTSLSAGNFVINKATPTIAWNNPADITHPTPLTKIQLNATANLEGSFVYTWGSYDCTPTTTPPINCPCVLPVGNNQPLSATFTPDSSNYEKPTATVMINVLAPIVTKEQVYDKWICTQRDVASGFPLAMYQCENQDGSEPECSDCMTAENRCGNLSPSDDAFTFSAGHLKWVGPTNETVDFVTVNPSVIFRCVEGTDCCFSCKSGLPWSCRTPNLVNIPTVATGMQQKIGNVWACSELPDPVSGCFTKVYSRFTNDGAPCSCQSSNSSCNRIDWVLSKFGAVEFTQGQLKSVGPGSDDPVCQAVYFVTSKALTVSTLCIYKCISDPNKCIPSEDPDNPYCCFSYCSPE